MTETNSLPKDILLIDKPPGISSFDVIRRLRKTMNVRKMGHAGTLDPQASGLLIIGVGTGTKKLQCFMQLPKTYRSTILLGKQTDTGDLDGAILRETVIDALPEKIIVSVLNSMITTLNLPVPVYSAVKQSGVPLYRRARKGEHVIPPIKPMTILSLVLHSVTKEEKNILIDMTCTVSKGTYIRSIAEEIGNRLGVPATLASLRRTHIGRYSVENAQTI